MSTTAATAPATRRPFPRTALLALATSAFVMGTAEFVIAGLLPDIAADLAVTVPAAGMLISAYAMAIVVGGPLFVVAGTRVPRHRLLVPAAALFVAGNAVAALAATYPVLMAARVISALGQGAFLAIASVVAADLVVASLRARAIAVVFAGGTAANVVGTPLGALLGQHLGWHATFWALAAGGAVALVAVVTSVPAAPRRTRTTLRDEVAAFRSTAVWFTLAIGAAGLGGLFAAYTYIAPLLTTVSGFPATAIAPLLAVFGVGLLAGNVLGGRFGAASQLRALGVALAVLTVGLAGLAVGARSPVVVAVLLVIVGASAFALVAPFMTRLIDQAPAAPLLAAAAGGSAVNLGAAAGAYLGGLGLAGPLGPTGPPVVGAALAGAGLLAVLVARRSS